MEALNQYTELIEVLFLANTVPMWIYDPESLKFLEVNEAAVNNYGFSYEEFKKMSIVDILPKNELNKLHEYIDDCTENYQISSSRHRKKDGSEIDVELSLHEYPFNGEKNRLAIARDVTDKNKVLNALKASESKYRGFFDKIAVGLAEVNIERTILKVNKKLTEIIGYSEKEIQGKKFTDITHPDDLKIGPYYFQKLIDCEADHFTYEKRYITKDNKIVWVKLTTTRLTDLKDEDQRFLSVIEDITENKNAEIQNKILAAIVENSDDAIIGMDLELNITSWNKGAEYIFGYSEREVIGKKNTFFHVAGQMDEDLINVKRLQSGEKVSHYYTKRMHKNGQRVDVAVTISRIKNSNNELIGFSKILRDVTQSIKAEQEKINLLELEKKARLNAERNHKRLTKLTEAGVILNSSLDYKNTLVTLAKISVPDLADWCAVELLDENGKLVRVAAEHIDPEKVKFAFEIAKKYPPDPDKNRGVYKVIKTGVTEVYEDLPDNILRNAAKSESHFNLIKMLGIRSAIISPLTSRDKVLGVIIFIGEKPLNENSLLTKQLAEALAKRAGIAIDNAHLYEKARELNYKLEERVKKRTKELENVNKELETFSYSVSHDLRAPLRAIDGFAEYLLQDYSDKLDDEGKRYLNVIKDNSVQMGTLIDDLLSFSRMNRTEMNVMNIDMKTQASGVCEELIQFEKHRKINFQIDNLPNVRGDYQLIKQVWRNLISNAIKYTKKRDKAEIHIGFENIQNRITYYIQDNGVGFDMKYVDKLFGVFQRLHKPSEFEGNGVGLATVKKIIARHGGEVYAEGVQNKGARFCFTMPVLEEIDNGKKYC